MVGGTHPTGMLSRAPRERTLTAAEWHWPLERTVSDAIDPEFESHYCNHFMCESTWLSSVTMLDIKMSADVAPQMNMGNPLHAGKEAHKQEIHPGFETKDRCHQKSKTEVSMTPQKGLLSSRFFF